MQFMHIRQLMGYPIVIFLRIKSNKYPIGRPSVQSELLCDVCEFWSILYAYLKNGSICDEVRPYDFPDFLDFINMISGMALKLSVYIRWVTRHTEF